MKHRYNARDVVGYVLYLLSFTIIGTPLLIAAAEITKAVFGLIL